MLNAPKSWAAARPDHFDSPGLSFQVAVVYLRNDCVPWKSDFASLASEKNKIATCGRFRHCWAARNDNSGTAFEVPAGLNWDMRLSAYVQLFFSLLNSSSAVVAEGPLRQSFNL